MSCLARGDLHFGILIVQPWLHLLFSLLSTSMLMFAHSTAHLIIYARNLAHASLKTAVFMCFICSIHIVTEEINDFVPK